ncbi:MAG: hypothetical protein WAV45_11665 [Propionibacteriaceae bacterium]
MTSTTQKVATASASVPKPAGFRITADTAGFVSPSGRIWCGMTMEGVTCMFPQGMNRAGVPSGRTACPGAWPDFDVNAMYLADAVTFACQEDPPSLPFPGQPDAAWAVGSGYPYVTLMGQPVPTLPYGYSLRLGRFNCESETTGMTCTNLLNGKGFRVAIAGATKIGG